MSNRRCFFLNLILYIATYMMNKKYIPISYPSSDKVYVTGEINRIRVGMRRINLSDTVITDKSGNKVNKSNNFVVVYDTTGPYSDSDIQLNVNSGIPRVKEGWAIRRKDWTTKGNKHIAKGGKNITQMYYAKRRIITPEMEYVAIRENQQVEALGLKSYITPDFVRKEIASGQAVIPSNINHPEAEPMIIGKNFLVKVNLPINYESPVNHEKEIEKIIWGCKWGSDILTEYAMFKGLENVRNTVLRNSPVPLCTTPLYEALEKVGGNAESLSWKCFRETLIEQAEQGVDCVIVHAGLLKSHLNLTDIRLTDIPVTAGVAMRIWMKKHKEENFLYTHFPEICEILKQYDVTLALGTALQSGSVYDSNDTAQFSEYKVLGELAQKARMNFIQVMVEGSGHTPLNKVQANIKEQQYICKQAPFYTSGLMTTDIAHGHNHVSTAIGGAFVAWLGASMISECNIGVVDKEDVKNRLIAHKIAAHSADIAKGHPGSQIRDNALSKAYFEKRWKDVASLSLDFNKTMRLLKKK